MFVDELTIEARAGNGGDGVVRWLRERYRPKGGPAGGNGGRGGDVYIKAVKDLALLSKYTGEKSFVAGNGEEGRGKSQHGHDGKDLVINLPVGATVTDLRRERVYTLNEVGETHKILIGGEGGLGNEYFKSSTNRTPEQATKGKQGEESSFLVELSLIVDIGLIGLPNAGKSTLLNTLTNTKSKVGAYPFTTVEPHLGDLYGLIVADIPGLIEGASSGKGLGHKFLRHVERTKMLLHCVSLEHENPKEAYETVRNELNEHGNELGEKEEWIILTKSDLTGSNKIKETEALFKEETDNVFTLSCETGRESRL